MMRFLLPACLLFLPQMAAAFPDMVRHGYNHCFACHVSPTGGGLLNDYGRSLSKELLSTWAYEGEEGLGHGLVPALPEWLQLGGDVRSIQTYMDTAKMREGRFIFMQADLELALNYRATRVVGSGGIQGDSNSKDVPEGGFISRRHYIQHQFTDELSARAGRYYFQYGLNIPNHVAEVREKLGFNQNQETYNLELAHFWENADVFATGVFGRPDERGIEQNRGGALSASYFFAERNKVGASAFVGKNNLGPRWMTGLWGISSLWEQLFLLVELDYLRTNAHSAPHSNGLLSYARLNYELHKGVQPYLIQEVSYLDLKSVRSRTDAFGLGLDFFPRPHLQFTLEYQRVRDLSRSFKYADFASLLFHYYL